MNCEKAHPPTVAPVAVQREEQHHKPPALNIPSKASSQLLPLSHPYLFNRSPVTVRRDEEHHELPALEFPSKDVASSYCEAQLLTYAASLSLVDPPQVCGKGVRK